MTAGLSRSVPGSLRIPRAPRGFTLVELLAVIAVMVLLMVLIVPAVGPLLNASRINTSASMITDELNFARQIALTRNRDVEVRFYQVESKTNPTDKQFRAFRTLFSDGTNPAKSKPLDKVKYLPEPVIIASAPNVSTLLDADNPNRSGLTRSQEKLPGSTTPAGYVSFLFRPTGGTNLSPVDPPDGNWFLTLYIENAPKNATTGIPANYFTAQIDAVTGRVRSYRP